MKAEHEPVALRELGHHITDVFARVRRGETVDVTEYGRVIARIVPIQEREVTPILERLAASGRLRAAVRPGSRPRMHPATGSDALGDALAFLRGEER